MRREEEEEEEEEEVFANTSLPQGDILSAGFWAPDWTFDSQTAYRRDV